VKRPKARKEVFETDTKDVHGTPIVITLMGDTLGLHLKGEPSKGFVVTYSKLLAMFHCNQL
jgi:hypothetical protein